MSLLPPQAAADRRGLVFGLCAYLWWGLSPLFWKQLDDLAAIDILGWRVLWTFVLVSVLVVGTGRRDELRAATATRTSRLASAAAAALIATNWGTYVWAVGAGRVTEASLGYFMNPLVSVFLGVVVLGESLRRAQWGAVALAAAGVAWLTIVAGTLPWVSLVLAGTFALYGLIRKVSSAGPLVGLNLEMLILVLPAAAMIIARARWADVSVVHNGDTMVWLALTGVITAAPLIWFAAAARRIPLSVLGLLQFLAPTLQFILGVVVYEEPFTAEMLAGYGIIWTALTLFAVDSWRVAGAARRLRPGGPANDVVGDPSPT